MNEERSHPVATKAVQTRLSFREKRPGGKERT